MNSVNITLASASPRRRELLDQIGVRYRVSPVDLSEQLLAGESPLDYVVRLALDKARAGLHANDCELPVLGADTAVVSDEEIFGKPVDESDAVTMLSRLSGRTHSVLSAVAVTNGEVADYRVSQTLVTFRQLSPDECHRYCATGEPTDKAGGYAIQGYGGVFVERIEGSYSGVVGLPLAETCDLLQQFNIAYWKCP